MVSGTLDISVAVGDTRRSIGITRGAGALVCVMLGLVAFALASFSCLFICFFSRFLSMKPFFFGATAGLAIGFFGERCTLELFEMISDASVS